MVHYKTIEDAETNLNEIFQCFYSCSKQSVTENNHKIITESVADPGFPRAWGRQHTILPIFFTKLHESERIWTPRGEHASKSIPFLPNNTPL